MWPNRILQSPGSRKNCRVRSSRTGGPGVRRGLWREQSSQAEAKDQGREAVGGLFLFTLSPRASLAYRTAVDRESQPIVNQRSGASRARPLANFSASWAASAFGSELLRGSAGPQEPRKSREMLPRGFRPGVIRILAVTFPWRVYIAHALGPELSVSIRYLLKR